MINYYYFHLNKVNTKCCCFVFFTQGRATRDSSSHFLRTCSILPDVFFTWQYSCFITTTTHFTPVNRNKAQSRKWYVFCCTFFTVRRIIRMLELGARGVEHLFVKSVHCWYLYINIGVENVLTETTTKRKGFLEQGNASRIPVLPVLNYKNQHRSSFHSPYVNLQYHPTTDTLPREIMQRGLSLFSSPNMHVI